MIGYSDEDDSLPISPRKSLVLNLAAFFGMIAVFILIQKYNSYKLSERIREENFFGNVDTMYMDPDSRMQPVAIINGWGKVSINNPIYIDVHKGDKLLKRKGCFKYYLIKGSDTTAYYSKSSGEEIMQ